MERRAIEHTITTYLAGMETPTRRRQLWLKRLVDLLVSALALVLLSPLLLLLALLIRLDSSGPVIFRQQRLGRYGRPFTIYKFRSMRPGAPVLLNSDGSTRVIDHDTRVTRLGALMRRTGLDELPQLYNILRGDMSLVGPRPDPDFYRAYYQEDDCHKLALRPGLTALAHICGRQTIPWRDRFAIERIYIEQYSLWLDLTIIAQTLVVIWRGIGVTNNAEQAVLTNTEPVAAGVSHSMPTPLPVSPSGRFTIQQPPHPTGNGFRRAPASYRPAHLQSYSALVIPSQTRHQSQSARNQPPIWSDSNAAS